MAVGDQLHTASITRNRRVFSCEQHCEELPQINNCRCSSLEASLLSASERTKAQRRSCAQGAATGSPARKEACPKKAFQKQVSLVLSVTPLSSWQETGHFSPPQTPGQRRGQPGLVSDAHWSRALIWQHTTNSVLLFCFRTVIKSSSNGTFSVKWVSFKQYFQNESL